MTYRQKPRFDLPAQVDIEEVIERFKKSDPKTARPQLDHNGHEIGNPIPIEPPLGYQRQPSLVDQIRQAVRAERAALEEMEPETYEEHSDFDVEDDPQPASRWENDTEPTINELRRRAREAGMRYDGRTGQLVPIEAEPEDRPADPPEPSGGDPERSRARKGPAKGAERSEAKPPKSLKQEYEDDQAE